MHTSHTAKIVDGFKKWSSDHAKRSNDNRQLGSIHPPVALNDALIYGPDKPPAIVTA
jgi:hypothetical protein